MEKATKLEDEVKELINKNAEMNEEKAKLEQQVAESDAKIGAFIDILIDTHYHFWPMMDSLDSSGTHKLC